MGEWTFSPEKGDVVFCSALDGWGFGLGDFARLWAKRLGCKPKELRRMLWGSFVFNPKTKKVRSTGGKGRGGVGTRGWCTRLYTRLLMHGNDEI